MLHSAKDSFEFIASRSHRFRDYLLQNNIRIEKKSVLYTILNSIDTALSIYKSGIIPVGIRPNEITSDAANAWFLAETILCANGTPFGEIVRPHLSLLASGDPRHIQAAKSSLQRNKLFEVILACILNNFANTPEFVDPPDVVARYKNTLWGFACKTLSGNLTTAAKRIREGLHQIEKAQVDFGIVAVQGTNLFPHDQMRFFNIEGKANT